FENLLLRDPYTDLAAGMRADRRIGDHALYRALPRDADQRRRIEPEQEPSTSRQSLRRPLLSTLPITALAPSPQTDCIRSVAVNHSICSCESGGPKHQSAPRRLAA